MRFSILPFGWGDAPKQSNAADRGATRVRPAIFEGLENRCLLTGAASDTAAAVAAATSASQPQIVVTQSGEVVPQVNQAIAPVARAYSGSMRFVALPGLARPVDRRVDILFNDRGTLLTDGRGQLTGKIVAAGIERDFVAQLQDRGQITLTFENGNLTGRLAKNGRRFSGVWTDTAANTQAKVRAAAFGQVGRLLLADGATVSGVGSSTGQPTTVVTTAIDTNRPGVTTITLAQTNGALRDTEGELLFVGNYSGSATLRQTPEVHGNTPPQPSVTTNHQINLTISSENSDDLLLGRMTATGLGDYDVVGVVKGRQMTLIVTPAANGTGGGVGVLHLRISNDGLTYSGRFEQEAQGILGFGTVTLTRQVGTTVPFNPATATNNNNNNGGTTTGGTVVGGTVVGGTVVGDTTTGGTTVVVPVFPGTTPNTGTNTGTDTVGVVVVPGTNTNTGTGTGGFGTGVGLGDPANGGTGIGSGVGTGIGTIGSDPTLGGFPTTGGTTSGGTVGEGPFTGGGANDPGGTGVPTVPAPAFLPAANTNPIITSSVPFTLNGFPPISGTAVPIVSPPPVTTANPVGGTQPQVAATTVGGGVGTSPFNTNAFIRG